MMKKTFITALLFFAASLLSGGVSYTVYSDFTVKDNTTGLIWTRCSLAYGGNAKTSPDCGGTVSGYSWEEALQACQTITGHQHITKITVHWYGQLISSTGMLPFNQERRVEYTEKTMFAVWQVPEINSDLQQ